MNPGDAGAPAGSAQSRPSARDLLLGRRYGVHRLIVFCLVAALIAVIAFAIVSSRTTALDGLPGVVRVDGITHQVELSSMITPAEAREVLGRARGLAEPWTLLLGPVRLTTAPGSELADPQAAADLLHRLGTARLAEPAVITVDPYVQSITAEPTRPSEVIPFARAAVTALSADTDVPARRLTVRSDPTVTVGQAALRRPADTDAVLALLERVPDLSQAVLDERLKARVTARAEAAAESTCAAAREALGERADVELTVSFGSESEPEAEPTVQPCE